MKNMLIVLSALFATSLASAAPLVAESTEFTDYILTEIRLTAQVNAQDPSDRRVVEGCKVTLRSDLKTLAPSGQVYTFQRAVGEGNSIWSLSYFSEDATQPVQSVDCFFYPNQKGQAAFSVSMLKAALAGAADVVTVVPARSSGPVGFDLVPTSSPSSH